eukprot:8784098-Pyramimonas_sp.AAC.1
MECASLRPLAASMPTFCVARARRGWCALSSGLCQGAGRRRSARGRVFLTWGAKLACAVFGPPVVGELVRRTES